MLLALAWMLNCLSLWSLYFLLLLFLEFALVVLDDFSGAETADFVATGAGEVAVLGFAASPAVTVSVLESTVASMSEPPCDNGDEDTGDAELEAGLSITT